MNRKKIVTKKNVYPHLRYRASHTTAGIILLLGASVGLGVGLGLGFSTNAHAQSPKGKPLQVGGATDTLKRAKKSFDISADNLTDALIQLGQQANIQLFFSEDLQNIRGKVSLKGKYSVQEAFQKILGDADLEVKAIDKDTYTVTRKKISPQKIEATETAPTANTLRPPDLLEEIIVTGSLLARLPRDTLYPLQTVTPKVLREESHAYISSAVQNLPSMCEPTYSLNSGASESNLGEAYPDLYCLGSQRTLSLINGRRVVSSNDISIFNPDPGLQVDLNIVPSLMLDRIEVVGAGGTPVYGSDGLAGTVNVKTKTHYQGAIFDVLQGSSQQGDATQTTIGALWGTSSANDNFSLVLAAEWFKQEALEGSQRDYVASNFGYVRSPILPTGIRQNLVFVGDVRNPQLTLNGIPVRNEDRPPIYVAEENSYFTSSGNPALFNVNGDLSEANLGIATLDRQRRIGGEGLPLNQRDFIALPLDKTVIAAHFTAQLTPSISSFLELNLAHTNSQTTPPVPVPVSEDLNSSFNSAPILLSNPFLKVSDRETLARTNGTGRFWLVRDWSGLLSGSSESTSQLARSVFGLEGEFSIRGYDWQWGASANLGWSSSNISSPYIDDERFEAAIRTVVVDGNIVCAEPVGNDQTEDMQASEEGVKRADCVPLNPFGQQASPEAREYIGATLEEEGYIIQKIASAYVSGTVAEFNKGWWKLGAGLDFRNEVASFGTRGDDKNKPLTQSFERFRFDVGQQSDQIGDPKNKFSTSEWYIENGFQLDDPAPFLDQVNIETNVRSIFHSEIEQQTAGALGLRLSKNTENFQYRLRGSVLRSIRSPSLIEFYRQASPSLDQFRDPCDRRFVIRGDSDEVVMRTQNCINAAAAISAPYQVSEFESQVPEVTNLAVSGTLNLENEISRSKTLGLEINERSDLWRVYADLVDITIDNAIVPRNVGEALDACYLENNADICRDIRRDPEDFQITLFRNYYENLGAIAMRGIEYGASAKLEDFNFLLNGQLQLEFTGFTMTKFTEMDGSNMTSTDRQGQSVLGDYRYPRNKWKGAVNYYRDKLTVNWSTYFWDKVSLDLSDRFTNVNLLEGYEKPELSFYILHHASMEYQLLDSVGLRIGVRNVFDTQPPAGLPSDMTGLRYDVIGRYFSAGIQFSY